MPNWKKIIVSGSDATLSSLNVTNAVTASNATISGNVGIGTTSPTTKLHVGDGTVDDAARVYFSDNSYTEMHGYGLQFDRAASYIRPTGDNNKTMYFGTDGATWAQIQFDASQYDLQTNGVSRFNIDTSGNVGIGTDSPGVALDVAGEIRATGDITAYYSSDERLKENIKPIENATDKVLSLIHI